MIFFYRREIVAKISAREVFGSPNFVTAMERIESRIVRDIEKPIAAYDE